MSPEQDNKATVGRLYQAFRAGDTAPLEFNRARSLPSEGCWGVSR